MPQFLVTLYDGTDPEPHRADRLHGRHILMG